MTRAKGSITIYMLLSLLLTVALICTLAESGRVSMVKARLKGITYMAADSCFAEFAGEIFEQYGIMALWKKEADFMADYNAYIQKNLDMDELGMYYDADLLNAEHQASASSDVQWLTDNNGMVFADQVSEYMNYYIVRSTLEDIIAQFDLFAAGSKASAFINKVNEYQDVFLKVGNTINKIQTAADKAKSTFYNPKIILSAMKTCLDSYESTGNVTYIYQFNSCYNALVSGRNTLGGYLDTIQTETDNYYQDAAQAEEAIVVLKEELEESRDSYTNDIFDSISAQLGELENDSTVSENDDFDIEANDQAAQICQDELAIVDAAIEDLGPSQIYGQVLSYKDIVSYYSEVLSELPLQDLGVNAQTGMVPTEDPGFLAVIGDVFSNGLLNAIVGPDISKKKIDQSDLPSKAVKRKSDGSSGSSLLSAGYKKILCGEYVLSHFSNFLEPGKDSPLAYEMEYIYTGKNNDKDNLEKVVRDIVLVRSGLNMVSLFRDPVKMEETEALAWAIIGFTGNPALVAVVKVTICGLWCIAEGLCDAKTLFAGGKVPMLKDSIDWTLSVSGLKNFSKSVIPSASSEKGESYEDYLRVLLFLESVPDLSYRTMDVIQVNVCEKYNEDFRMSECINKISLETQFSAPQLFSTFIFVHNTAGNGRGKYNFTFTQEYSY